MRLYTRTAIFLGTILMWGTGSYAAEHKRDREQLEQTTRLQIFLDNSNFGPRKIDGKEGEFTKKAVMAFKRPLGHINSQTQNSKIQIDQSGLDLSSIDHVFTTYVITKGDIENVGELPSDLAAQAKMKWLPYNSLAETIAEKFHCDIDFLKKLNPEIFETLKEGDVVTVPNGKNSRIRRSRAATLSFSFL